MTDKKPITKDDLLRLQMVGDPQISPDGAQVAFVRRYIDVDENASRSEIWLAPTDGGRPARRFTGGSWSDSEPCWSPDGSTLAFVSDRQDESAQIFVISLDGGEARALTALPEGGVSALRWAPDGARLAFRYRATPTAYTKEAVKEREEKKRSAPPRIHTRLSYRLDGFGYWGDSYWQVWTADTATGAMKAVTEGTFSCGALCWSPDGGTLAFLSDRRPDSDMRAEADTQIWHVPASGGALTRIVAPDGEKAALTWSPDGQWCAYVGNPDPLDQWGIRNEHVYVLPAEGGAAEDVMEGADMTVGYLTLSDARDSGGNLLCWSGGGDRLFFPVAVAGDTRLGRAAVGGGALDLLTPAGQEMGSFSLARHNALIALTLGRADHPHEVFAGTVTDGEYSCQAITSLNAPWVAEIALKMPEPFTIANGQGDTVPGWVLTPPNFAADGTFPLVLSIHGGPHLQYGNVLFHELQWLAANGYVVAYANPRGSKGYGEAHTAAIKGDWGGPPWQDLSAVVDELLARGYADRTRLAVMGGSYGGYLTAWAIGHTDRFACAIADRLVANLHSMSGTADFPWSHGTYYRGNAWDDPADLWQHSPLAFAGRINTPLLLIHSEGDLRCPIGQAEELFAALRLQRKMVEFVRYPAETSHGLSRNGPPDLRLDRLRRNLAWLDKYLKPPEEKQ